MKRTNTEFLGSTEVSLCKFKVSLTAFFFPSRSAANVCVCEGEEPDLTTIRIVSGKKDCGRKARI